MDSNRRRVYIGDMGWLSKIKAPTITVEPMTFYEAITHMGLPANTIIREEDVTYELWANKSNLPTIEDRKCYAAQIRNMGRSVAVLVGGKKVCEISETAIPEAVDALRAYGGKVAPAVLVIGSETRRTDRVMVPKR